MFAKFKYDTNLKEMIIWNQFKKSLKLIVIDSQKYIYGWKYTLYTNNTLEIWLNWQVNFKNYSNVKKKIFSRSALKDDLKLDEFKIVINRLQITNERIFWN